MNSLSFEAAQFLAGDRPDAPARVRLLAGAGMGACLAIFVPILLLVWLVEGPEAISQKGLVVRVDMLTVLYPVGAVIAGALLLLLAPFGRNRVGKALLGVVAFAPWLAAIAVCLDRGHADWQPVHTFLTCLGAVVFGAPIGWFAHPLTATRAAGRPPASAI